MTKTNCQRNNRKINDGVAQLARPSHDSRSGFLIRETDEPSCFINANAVSESGMTEHP